MYENIKNAFESLISNNSFQELVLEYRHRFGIPINGFSDLNSDEYINWIKEGVRKSDYLKDQFLFLAKRCKNLAPDKDPVPLTVIAYYFLFNKNPSLGSGFNEFLFSIQPSGILGSFDITFTVPLLFDVNNFLAEVEKHKVEIAQISDNAKLAISNLSKQTISSSDLDSSKDLLETTPGNGGDIVDRVHRDIGYLIELGRVALRESLNRMKDDDFIIKTYNDKNRQIDSYIQQMGGWLLNRGLYPIAEGFWKNIDEEICDFNKTKNKRINRGIPLANQGVAQIAQGKVIEGLFNLYKAYKDDKECLAHLPGSTIDPEKDLPASTLYAQFETRQISFLFNSIVTKYSTVFSSPITEADLTSYILSLSPDKKILLFVTLYRFAFSYDLNNELSNPVNRGEILRSMSELALWYEDEIKRKNPTRTGTLGDLLQQLFVQQLNSPGIRGEYTDAGNLTELDTKIKNAISNTSDLNFTNARIITCVRNFTGHNFESRDHPIFSYVGEVVARMISLIVHSHNNGWV